MKLVYIFDGESIPMWVQLLFWLFYMVVFAYAFKKTLLSSYQSKRSKDVTWLFIVCFTLYAIFYCINDDYFQYRNWLDGVDYSFWTKEQFYVYVILFCRRLSFDYPYEVFRLIVWGGAVCIAYFTFRMYRGLLLPGLALLLLFVFYSGTFCYGRASLAMAVYFLGIALYLNYKGVLLRSIGVVLAISSYYLHHEMIVGVALLPCLFIPLERKEQTLLSVLGLIIAIIALSYLSSNVEYLDSIFDNDDLSTRIENYDEKGQGAFRLSTLMKYLNFFYPFYLITKYFWKKKVSHSFIGIYRIMYGILMVSVAFMVVFGARSVFGYRIMYIAMIPLTLLIGYGYCNGYFTKRQFLLMMILALLSNSIRFINAQ